MESHGQDQFYCKGFAPTPAPPVRSVPSPGADWERPGDLPWPDAALKRAYHDSRGAFYRQSSGGFQLAYPLSCRLPFPLPLLFCFVRVECLGSRGWWVFSFNQDGVPRFDGV